MGVAASNSCRVKQMNRDCSGTTLRRRCHPATMRHQGLHRQTERLVIVTQRLFDQCQVIERDRCECALTGDASPSACLKWRRASSSRPSRNAQVASTFSACSFVAASRCARVAASAAWPRPRPPDTVQPIHQVRRLAARKRAAGVRLRPALRSLHAAATGTLEASARIA